MRYGAISVAVAIAACALFASSPARAVLVTELLCSPQVGFSESESDYIMLKTCDSAGCVVKVLGKMAEGKTLFDLYGHSGDFKGNIFAGDVGIYEAANSVSFHCAPPGEGALYFVCMAWVEASKVPDNAMMRVVTPGSEVCGFSPKLTLKVDADGNNKADDDEGESIPEVDLEVAGDEAEEGGDDSGDTGSTPFTPPTDSGFAESGGCSLIVH